MQIKAILFDIDGTLADSNDLHVLAWQQAFAEIGKTFDAKTIHDQIGKGADMLVPFLLPDADEILRQKATDGHDRIFKSTYLKQVKLFAEARALLAHAHDRGQKVALASSASAEELDHYLDLLDARDLVDAGTSSGDVENTKPSPDIFAAALAKLPGIGAAETIVVGDTPYDIEAAAKCGIGTIAVRSGGFSGAVLQEAGALVLYDDVAALLADYDHSPLGR